MLIPKSSYVIITAVPKADHSKSSSSFSDSKHFVCSTCHKCVFNVNHDACITKLLKEVNPGKVKSHKTRNSNKPIEKKSHTQKPSRKIFTGYRFSPNKSFVVYEKSSPRSCLSEPPHGSNVDISKIHECKQTLNLSAEFESLFGPLFDEYFNGENQVVSKSSAVTTSDAFNKRQQQPDSTSSTSTLATTVTADGNFDL
ncbi:putative ribonuclease H-like domain-containing protein [Tanacetum coccineum]